MESFSAWPPKNQIDPNLEFKIVFFKLETNTALLIDTKANMF